MKKGIFIFFFSIIKIVLLYDCSDISEGTADSVANLDRYWDGQIGCWKLYDHGANVTTDCTQFHLEKPFKCCLIEYVVDSSYSNKFCMPVPDNDDAIGDVEDYFDNAKSVDIQCFSKFNKIKIIMIFVIFILFFY